MTVLEFHAGPDAFLDAAGSFLAADPVRGTVIATVTARLGRDGAAPDSPDAPAPWWLVVRAEDGTVVGAAMRTAPFAPRPPYLSAMPEQAARLVARTLYERGETVEVVNGFVPAIEAFAAEMLALAGGTVRELERTMLYEVRTLVEPPQVPGRLRLAVGAELDLVQSWFDAFGPDASAQAGRPDPHPQIESRDSTARRIAHGDVWVWETPQREVVQVTGFSPPSFGVARVGPVYTPPENRGRGYAAAAVAELSSRTLAAGARVCLFADQQNRTSTGVYLRLGYQPVGETAGLLIAPAG